MRTETAEIIEIDYEHEADLFSEAEEVKDLKDLEALAGEKGISIVVERIKHHGVLARENGHTVMILSTRLSEAQQTLVGFHLYCRYLLNCEETYAMRLPDNYVLLNLIIDLHRRKNGNRN
jgi:hypothetical protein